ncbi:MAG: KilA-N domain-containing protein [Bacteroidota bacterium]
MSKIKSLYEGSKYVILTLIMAKNKHLTVNNVEITWQVINEQDYICLTDMVRSEERHEVIIQNWLRNTGTLTFLAAWEELNNPQFKYIEFDVLLAEAGYNRFTMSVKKWRERVDGIGLISKKGRNGGTYAYKDIAFEFGTWISPKFKLLLIREFQRLKKEEANQQQLEWNTNRFLTKRNYSLQTEAIKQNLLPLSTEPPEKDWITYANEADILNVALFGTTAKQWRAAHSKEAKQGENIRDYASNIQLLVLSNLGAINAELIRESLPKEQRFEKLQEAALFQLNIFNHDAQMKKLK